MTGATQTGATQTRATLAGTALTGPAITSHTLTNGLRVTIAELATTPLVHAHLAVPFDLPDRRTLAVVDVLSAAWADLPAGRRFELVGGKISISRRRNWVILSLTCLDAYLVPMLEVLAAAVDGSYSEEDVRAATAKCEQQSRLVSAQPAALSQRHLWAQVYGGVPPALEPAPEAADFDGIDHEDLTAVHRRQVSPATSRLILVGDLSTHWAMGRIRSVLGWWSVPETVPPQALSSPPTLRPARRPSLVRHPVEQLAATHVRLAAESFPVDHPQAFTAASVANVIVGGNFSSRLNRIIRERDGLAYRVGSTLIDIDDRVLSVIEVDVARGATGAALGLIADVLDELADLGPTEAEVADAVGYILGSYELSLGSQSGLGACLLSYLITGIDLARIDDLPDILRAFTPDDLRPAFELLRPAHYWGTVTGPDAGWADLHDAGGRFRS